MQDKHPRISIDPRVCHGKAVVRDTRVPVANIVGALLAGQTLQEIIEDYPVLTESDIKAASVFAKEVGLEQ